MKKSLKQILLITIFILLLGLIGNTILTYKVYYIPTSSMENSIMAGDYILIKKTDKYLPRRGSILLFTTNNGQNEDVFVKRCVGLPGDTLFIERGVVYCNSKPEKHNQNLKYLYHLRINPDSLINMSDLWPQLLDYKVVNSDTGYNYKIILPRKELNKIKTQLRSIGNIFYQPEPQKPNNLFPWSENIASSIDNFGPVLIPKKGVRIQIDNENYDWYKSIIKRETDPETDKRYNIELNSSQSFIYIFQYDYLFLMGDNRNVSSDSRMMGFIPVDNVSGEATRILVSRVQKNSNRFSLKLERAFKPIK